MPETSEDFTAEDSVTTLTIMELIGMPVRLELLYSYIVSSLSILLSVLIKPSCTKWWLRPEGKVPIDSDLGEPFCISHTCIHFV